MRATTRCASEPLHCARLALRVLACALLLGAAPGARGADPCKVDADCKLLYDSCGCEAVSASDPRKALPSEVDCAVNRCRVENARAACVGGECAKTADGPPRAR
jgi:hypothetical protein